MYFSEIELINRFPFQDPNPVFVDVGGHVGSTSIIFAQKGWHVIAFEPELKNRERLEKRLLKFSKVKIIPKAVSDQTGEIVPFYTSDQFTGIHSLKPFHQTHSQTIEVETITLNDALDDLDFKNVTFLKVDTEGADFLALKGIDLKRYQPDIVMIEFMDSRSIENFGYDHHEVSNYMREFNYKTYVSEWEPIIEYQKEGESSTHKWIQCAAYPLDHEPAWGNLIFVKDHLTKDFEVTFKNYIRFAKMQNVVNKVIKNPIKKIPGAYNLYKLVKRI